MTTSGNEALLFDEHDERVQRARRLASMFDRWASEDVFDEPEWHVKNIESLTFRASMTEAESNNGKK